METEQAEKPKWVDKNRNYRANKRRAQLNAIAQQHGFSTWVKLETACLNGAELVVFPAPEVYNGVDFVVSNGVYHLQTTGGVGLGEFTADSLISIVPIPEDHGSIS